MEPISLELDNKRKLKFLQLTGISSLYDDPLTDTALDITWYKDELDNDYTISVAIICHEFETLAVKIDMAERKITNELIVGRQSTEDLIVEPGAVLKCLSSQVDYAVKYGIRKIELDAYRSKTPLKLNGKDFPWTGYKVWGKYGYQMYIYNQRKNFREKMFKNTNLQFAFIHELYTGTSEANTGRDSWNTYGEQWFGRFSLDRSSTSQIILQDLKDKWNLSSRFNKHVS